PRRAGAPAGAASLLLEIGEVAERAPVHRARRGGLLGAARLPHVRRPVARAALHRRPVTARAPRRWQEARIARIAPLTPRIVQVELEAPSPAHRAGQHLDVRLTAPDGYQAQRSYSICSAPGAPRVALAIERLEDGEVSPYFHEVAEPGDTFEVRGPIGGHFV